MEEKIVSPEVAEKAVETAVKNVDLETLKYLGGAFGVGAVVGVIVYSKVMIPAWRKMKESLKPREIVIAQPEAADAEEKDENPSENP